MYDYWDHGMRNGYDAWGGFFMILVLILLVLGVVLVVRYVSHDVQGVTKRDDALEILRQRFAKGEIDKKEFEEKKKALK